MKLNITREALQASKLPLFFLAIYCLLYIAKEISGIGFTASNLFQLAESYIIEYGFSILIFIAFLEGLIAFNFYFPGSFIVLVAAIVSNHTIGDYAQIGFYSLIGFILANVINFFIGKFGLRSLAVRFIGGKEVEKMQQRIKEQGFWNYFIFGFHPNYLAISVISSGIMRENFFKVISLSSLSLFIWICIWITALSPFVQNIDLNSPEQDYVFIILLLIWFLIVFIKNYYRISKAQATKIK